MTPTAAFQTIKILLVEDDEDDYLLTRDLLADIQPERYKLDWLRSFEEAVELDRPDEYDVCLLDYRLGNHDGLELMQTLQSKGYSCPMILLTGQGDSEVDHLAMKTGASDYLIKGQISAPTLERSVRYAIQQRQFEKARIDHVREQEARMQAETANRAKDDFLANLSHELRTPLNVMLGWVQLLKTGSADTEVYSRAIDAIERSARTQKKLVEDLLDISRIVNDNLQVTMQPLDPASVVRPAVEGMRPVAEARNIDLSLQVDADGSIINGDKERLQQVVDNLLSNAIKFTPEGGAVNVSLTKKDGSCIITVADNGKGIDLEFLPHIFERYAQGPSTKSTRRGGLGLGLAIVRRIVEMHDGTISANSEGEGKGASFVVTLPLI
jgi:signal transduction histidine kinase